MKQHVPGEGALPGGLVLSLFPGIGLLDLAFEMEGFCVVRGPDLLWGGDIKSFHPPAGKFGGVLGGPPCQAFSTLAPLIKAVGGALAEDLIPEFVRCVAEARPAWFLMENVRRAPVPQVPGYFVDAPLYDNRWIGGEQSREHRFSFGTLDNRQLSPHLEVAVFEYPRWAPRVLASGGHTPAPLEGGNGAYRKRDDAGRPIRRIGGQLPHDRVSKNAHLLGRKTTKYFIEAKRLQGLPADWDLPGFKVAEKVKALGNGVPLPMGRAIARAVKRALC
jgi:DNA (cytosine-5)-methyltransferase 1